MKTFTRLSYVLFLSISLCFVSCSGDDDNGSAGGGSGEYVKAKVDGKNFSSSTSYDLVAASRPTSNAMAIQGSNNEGHAIQITLFAFDGEGTYNVGDQLIGQALYTKASTTSLISYSSAAGGGANGEVTITYIDDEKVEGTFSFKGRKAEEGATEMVEVTNGKFRAKFQ